MPPLTPPSTRPPPPNGGVSAPDGQTIKNPQSLMETDPSGQRAFYLSISLFTVLKKKKKKKCKIHSVEIQRIGVMQNKVLILGI